MNTDVDMMLVLVATVANIMLGFFWYSPKAFGAKWMKLTGMTEKKAKDDMGHAMVLGFFGTFMMVYIVAVLMKSIAIVSPVQGLFFGFLLWLGLVLPTELSGVAWERRPMELMWINTSHSLIGVLVTIAILMA